MPKHMLPLLSSDVIVDIIIMCDSILYKVWLWRRAKKRSFGRAMRLEFFPNDQFRLLGHMTDEQTF